MGELIGRDADLRTLRGLLGAIGPGAGEIVLVVGEAGAGKTALLDAFASEARQRIDAAWGDSFDGEGAPPCWPWIQVLGALVGGPGRAAAVEAALAALRAPMLEESTRFAAFNLVAEAICMAAAPALIVLDDLHWADGASLALLELIAPRVRRAPVLLALGARPGQGPAVEAALGSLMRRGARRLDLRPLSAGEVATLLNAAGADPSRAEAVHRATGGNPLFAGELARHLAAGTLAAVPSSLSALLRAELRRLHPGAQRLAEVCAAFDGIVDPDFATRVAGVHPSAFDELAAAGLVDLDGASCRFRHDTIRDAIRAAMSSSERTQVDAAIAAEAERRGNRVLVAVHGCRAAAAWQPGIAHAAAVAMRDQLAASCAVEAAAGMAALARSVRRLLDLPRPELLALELADGEVYTSSGHPAEAREILRGAAALARGLDDPEALARIALVFGLGYEHSLAHDSEVLALLHEALERLPAAAHSLRARVLARLAWQELGREVGGRDALSAEAVAEARRSEDAGALAVALNARCWGLSAPTALAERRATAVAAWAAARDAGDIDSELGALLWRFHAELESGDLAAARAAATAFDAITTRSPLPYHRWYAYLLRGTLAMTEGRFDEARALAREIDPAATTQFEMAELNALLLLAEVDIAASSETRLVGLRRMHEYIASRLELDWLTRPCIAVLEEGPAAGRVELARLMKAFEATEADEDWVSFATSLAAVAILAGDRPVARTLYDRLRPFDGSWVVLANGASCRGPVAGYLAGLAGLLGHSDDAEAYRVRASEAVRAAGAAGVDYWMHLAPLPERHRRDGEVGLTPREAEVLALVARGHTNQEIADALVLSVRTVQRHVENLYGRLGLHTRAAATLAAVELGLVEPGDVRVSRTG